MASKQSGNNWKNILDNLHFTDTLDIVKSKIADISDDYTYDQFIKDCEAFYDLYIDFVGFNDDKSPSKNLQVQFHKVARILNMNGHVPDAVEQEATQSMFDYISGNTQEQQQVRNASSHENQDDFYLQDHLAFGLSNDLPTDNVDRIEMVEGTAKLNSCKVLNIKVASENLASDSDYVSRLVSMYKIGNSLIDTEFNKDKMILSLYYK